MAWTYYVEDHGFFSDRWMVSTLIRALGELFLEFIVLICVAISVLTAKLIRSSGLCLSCHSCQQDRRGQADAPHKRLPPSQNKPRQLSASSLGRDISSVCDECAQRLSGFSCCSSGTETENGVNFFPLGSRELLRSVSSSSLGYQSCFSELSSEEDCAGFQCLDGFFMDTADDFDERSVRDASGKPSGAYVNVAVGSDLPSSLSKRPRKRKFAKVFPGDTARDSSSRDPAKGFVDQLSVGSAKKSPADGIRNGRGRGNARYQSAQEKEAVEDEECDEDAKSVPYARKQSVVSVADDIENMSWEESLENSSSSHDSFAYIRRLPWNSGASELAAGRKAEVIASDFRGNITPEWSERYETPDLFDEMEKGGDDEDDRIELYSGVEELREAFQAERKALAELYRELEQERNASASAANEAMAMITRLQEEKAAAQMECRQFQRIAEEKQLYDQEAMALLQEILVQRDQEVFRLEEEAKLYRQRLLGLTRDKLHESPQNKSDFLMIESETLLLEDSVEWKEKKNRREEKLLAEIKKWVTAANERTQAPPNVLAIKEDEERLEKAKLSGNISNMSIDVGRKNLLESFNEEVSRDGSDSEAGSSAAAAGAAGYESFHIMMESLRKEPRLCDEASLETLSNIEEKFEKQSQKGKVKNEEDLRNIWKNTLRSFGRAVGENLANTVNRSSTKQDLKGLSEEDSSDISGLLSGIVRDTEANKAMEQKTISVLNYVWKFEEQLHQGMAKKLCRTSSNKFEKQGSEAGFGEESSNRGTVLEFLSESDREELKRLSSDGSRLPPSKFRRHASEVDRFQLKGEASVSPRIAAKFQEGRSERPSGREHDELGEGSLVHDVYEMESESLEASISNRKNDSVCNWKVTKSSVSNPKKLVLGESAYSSESDVFIEPSEEHGDRLRKPEPLYGYSSSECKENGEGRSCSQSGTGRYVTSLAEDETSDQDFDWPATPTSGRDRFPGQAAVTQAPGGRTPQTPTTKTDDVVDQLSARLRTLEADRQEMQQTISSLRVERAENGEMLREIANQLREFRGVRQKETDSEEPQEATLSSAIKGIVSFSHFRCSVQAQLNKLARLFLRNVDLGVCRGDQHVGLCRLLQISPQRPIRVTRRAEVKAEEIVLNGLQEQEASLYQAATSTSTLLSQQSWPLDERERSGTALSGWDY
ncbi:hypothetical protein R1flu_001378 [Riccia fluitans]|uniref:GTD-binding domain-containing protein n=1 Tax=Riccia fluitans TaxID=41844 RepID=A0ABD1Y342_9MARC